MQRRELIRTMLLSGVGVALKWPTSKIWADSVDPSTIDPDFIALTEAIMPETNTPGAIAAGVPTFVMSAIYKTDDPGYAQEFIEGLEAFKEDCVLRHTWAFRYLSSDQVQSYLSSLSNSGDKFFMEARIWTIIGYYTSEVGMTQALTYNPIPGSYAPCLQVTDETRAEATYF